MIGLYQTGWPFQRQVRLYQTGWTDSRDIFDWIVSDRSCCVRGTLDCIRQVGLYQRQDGLYYACWTVLEAGWTVSEADLIGLYQTGLAVSDIGLY